MSEKQLIKALNAIHDEAAKLLGSEVSEDTRKGLELIVSISRHHTDVRSSEEKST